MSARQALGNIARRRLVSPKVNKRICKMVHELGRHSPQSRSSHLCRRNSYPPAQFRNTEQLVYYGVGVVYMFIQSRKNKGELRRKLIEVSKLHL